MILSIGQLKNIYIKELSINLQCMIGCMIGKLNTEMIKAEEISKIIRISQILLNQRPQFIFRGSASSFKGRIKIRVSKIAPVLFLASS